MTGSYEYTAARLCKTHFTIETPEEYFLDHKHCTSHQYLYFNFEFPSPCTCSLKHVHFDEMECPKCAHEFDEYCEMLEAEYRELNAQLPESERH